MKKIKMIEGNIMDIENEVNSFISDKNIITVTICPYLVYNTTFYTSTILYEEELK